MSAHDDLPHILVFNKTAGFVHGSIPAASTAVQQLATQYDFEVTITDDATSFNDTTLAGYDAVVFLLTTGDVLNTSQEQALQTFIQAGNGFIGVHSASDTEMGWAWYGDLVGAYFTNHPPGTAQASVKILDRSHPSTAHFTSSRWLHTDEWYNFDRNPRGNVHTLMVVDESTYSGGELGYDHPITWCQEFDGGRSWYTALGDTDATYSDGNFRQMLANGILWAAGAVGGTGTATVDAQFEKIVIDSAVSDPMELDVAPDGRVFFVERGGALKIIDPVTDSTSIAANLSVYSGQEDGLIGIALDPNFATNNWIYLMYSPSGSEAKQHVSRFTMNGNTLDLSSEIIMLEIPTQRDQCCHSGGCMQFGPDGNLFISTGDDTNPFNSNGYAPIDERSGRAPWDAQKSSSDTNDLRGKILRITPQPDGSYTIPTGNLFPPGTALTKPEIYIMGCRNPFRLSIDPSNGWVYFGDVGPDAGQTNGNRGPRGYDEINQVRTAGNYGWPYALANNLQYRDFNFANNQSGSLFSLTSPGNDSPNNKGLTSGLPAAQPAWIYYHNGATPAFPAIPSVGGRTAMAGPVYRSNPSFTGEGSLPGYYDGTFFFYEWSRNFILDVKIDENGDLLHMAPFAADVSLSRPIDLELSPDGILYAIEWGTGFGGNNPDAQIVKISFKSDNSFPVAVATANRQDGPAPLTVQFSSAGSTDPDPIDTISLAWDFDLDGTVDSTAASPSHTYTVPGNYTAQLRVTDSRGASVTQNIAIAVGNSRPVLTIPTPFEGQFYGNSDRINFTAAASDVEDGNTPDNGITMDEVEIETFLGHDDHVHGITQFTGTSGSFVAESDHAFGDNLAFVVRASYTDQGAPGVSPLTGSLTRTLQPKTLLAQHASGTSGTSQVSSNDAAAPGINEVNSVDDGDWLSYEPINLAGIGFLDVRVAPSGSGGRVELRRGSPTGTLAASVLISPDGGNSRYQDFSAPVVDPGGTHTYYLFFKSSPGGGSNLFQPVWFTFRGAGATTVPERPHVSSMEVDPAADTITLEFDSAMRTVTLEEESHYHLTGGLSVSDAVASANLESVTLTVPGLTTGTLRYLSIGGVEDLEGDPISPGTAMPVGSGGGGVETVAAINSNGPSFTASDGTVYSADQFFTGGNTFQRVNPISGTTDDALYQTERFGDFSYSIPMENGDYSVTLKFAELFFTQNNQRVFSVTAEGQPFVTNLDLHAVVGHDVAYDVTQPVTISGGDLNLSFSATTDNAKIGAILVQRETSGAPFTDFASWEDYHSNSPLPPLDDSDGDGKINFVEYAMGTLPLDGDDGTTLPETSMVETTGGDIELVVRFRKAASDVSYEVQWSDSLESNSWTPLPSSNETFDPNTGLAEQRLMMPAGEIRAFIRMVLRSSP